MTQWRKQQRSEGDLQGQEALLVNEPALTRSEGASFLRRYLLRSAEVFMYWMPVWVPLILLAQIGTRGLKPAMREEQRLLRQEELLRERLEADELEAQQLGDTLEALDDPIFIERLRRQRQARQQEEVERRGLTPIPSLEGEKAAEH